MTLAEFRKKYGVRTPGLLIEKFIGLAPDFPGGERLARLLGEMVADLEAVLATEPERDL